MLKSRKRGRPFLFLLFLWSFPFWLGSAVATGSSARPDLFSALRFRHVGPVGNRITAVAGVMGDWNVYYAGAASGGVFKTEDGGTVWRPIFDEQPAQSIGAVAIAPSDVNVVWVGTGEAHIRSNISIGNGIYRSTDGGRHWSHLGLELSGRISRIVVDPQNPDRAWVAALGHCYGPQEERGVFETSDGGKSWKRVLFVDPDTGASDVVMDPNNRRILLAGMWQMVIWPWGRQSGGPGSGLYRSRDGGESWEHLTGNGLPDPPWGKVALSISADNSDRVYALIETASLETFGKVEEHPGVLWTSDDGGDNWRLTSADHTLAQRPHYYSRVVASPDDFKKVHFLSTEHSLSRDGGLTFERVRSGHDHHDMWLDPLQPERMIVGHDGGVSISTNDGSSWRRIQLPAAQMYHVSTDHKVPYFLYGNRQDGSSFRGPSNSLTASKIPVSAWHSVGGCESGFAIPDPVDTYVVWSGCYEGILDRFDLRTEHSRDVSVWPDNGEAWPGADLRYRFQWTFPILISPHDHRRVYVGSQFVHVTTNGGESWEVLSLDLTSNDKSRQKKFGGLTSDDEGPTMWPTLFALAESPLEEGVLWAGTNDGRVHVSRDQGKSWLDVTPDSQLLPPLGQISNIEPSRFEEGRAYITVDLHQLNNSSPYLFKTLNYGESWTSLGAGIPAGVFSYAHCIREDPQRPGLLYLGTENSLYVSFDDGETWSALQSNLPHAPVHWLTVQEEFNDLVVATYGRGFWILDDLTPLQQLNEEVLASQVHFFSPRAAYRFRLRPEPVTGSDDDPSAGDNPSYGASFDYYLLSERSDLRFRIEDPAGEMVRELTDLPGRAGLNRVYWDLRYEPLPEPRLMTRPLQHSHVPLGEEGYRSLKEGRKVNPLAPPGLYKVTLEGEGTSLSRTLQVLKDPHSAGTVETIRAQTRMALELRGMIRTAISSIEEMESVRKQLRELSQRLETSETDRDIQEEMANLGTEVQLLEGELFDLRLTPARQDVLWWPRRLYAKMTILLEGLQQADFAPTRQQGEVFDLYKKHLREVQERWGRLRDHRLAELRRQLEARGFRWLGS